MKSGQDSNHRRRGVRGGFSLLEMVIVLGIIAVIIGGAVTVMGNVGEGAKLQRVKADMQSLGAALKMYKINAGQYPTTAQGLDALVNKPTSTPVPKGYTSLMKEVPKDPWNNDYGYRFPGRKDATEYEIICTGKDGKEGGDDDLSSQD